MTNAYGDQAMAAYMANIYTDYGSGSIGDITGFSYFSATPTQPLVSYPPAMSTGISRRTLIIGALLLFVVVLVLVRSRR